MVKRSGQFAKIPLLLEKNSGLLISTSDFINGLFKLINGTGYKFIVYLDSSKQKISLNFHADKESVVFKKIKKQDTINDN